MNYPLSDKTKALLRLIKEDAVKEKVMRTFATSAALYAEANVHVRERVAWALIKVAIDTPDNINNAIKLYAQDTRDLLGVAGLASNLNVHLDWADKILNNS